MEGIRPMTPVRFRRGVPALLVVLVAGSTLFGCGPGDEADQPTAEELEEFRSEVNQALEAIRIELETLQERLVDEAPDQWVRLTNVAEDTREELNRHLERVDAATADEAREVRQVASEHLARLEAEVVRSDLKLTEDPIELRETAEGHLFMLEGSLHALHDQAAAAPGQADAPESSGRDAPVALTPEKVAELEERLERVRETAATVAEAPEAEFAEVREEVSLLMAELTEDLRKAWYLMRWESGA